MQHNNSTRLSKIFECVKSHFKQQYIFIILHFSNIFAYYVQNIFFYTFYTYKMIFKLHNNNYICYYYEK